MTRYDIIVDYNGIVLFDRNGLEFFYGGGIADGTNLYHRFTTTDDGDAVVVAGIISPVLGLNDSIYKVYVRMADEPSALRPETIVVSNACFPFHATGPVILADMSTLLEWYPDEGWQQVDIAPGFHAITVNGFRVLDNGIVADFGFEFVLEPRDALPAFTGSLDKSMQVLTLP